MFAEARISLFVFFSICCCKCNLERTVHLWIPGSNILESGVNPRVPFLVKVVFFSSGN
ncbi:hypothetical protein ERO13_D01G168550v2 [Gossypium hirsutum]|uniref:Uncharacterized protein n=1 Tax=Gossypium mustelinum TaxID=34275 RepID=A0A5D2WBW1_GOSMU|nr:hypothetical protein ERO13_D01G168550v2 [Gossypium hirsutum]TYI98360.1 hypothetical protein E1A91_D01G208700v1 [Gossypium mustelinum]